MIKRIKHGSRLAFFEILMCFIYAQVEVSLAIIGVDKLLIEVEGLAAVLTWLVVNVVVSVIVHEAEPLQEGVQKQVELVLTVTWIVALYKLLIQIQIKVVVFRIFVIWALWRLDRTRIYVLFFSGCKLVHRKVKLEVPVPILGQALYAVGGVDRRRLAIYMFSILLFFLLAFVFISTNAAVAAGSRVNRKESEHLYHECHLFLRKK